MRVRNPYTKHLHTKEFETNNQASKTVPNQAMSIPELMHRYVNGLPLGGSKVPSYSEDPENDILGGVDFRTLDLSEQYEVMKNVNEEINDIKSRKNQRKKSFTEPVEDKTKNNTNEAP